MSANPIQLALKKLQQFYVPNVGGPTRRTNANLHDLIVLSAAFVHQLEQSGNGELLDSGFSFIKRAITGNKRFEGGLRDAKEIIDELLRHAPTNANAGDDVPTANDLEQMKIRIADSETMLWNFKMAHADVERLLAMRLSRKSQTKLQRWQDTLSSFILENEKGHKVGVWLLYRIDAISRHGAASPDRQSLCRKIFADFDRVVAILQDAAAFLCSLASGDSRSQNSHQQEKKDYFHDSKETMPSEFDCEKKLRGQLIQLTWWIYGHDDRRILKTAGKKDEFWIKKYSGQDFEVFFRDRDQYARAKKRHDENPS